MSDKEGKLTVENEDPQPSAHRRLRWSLVAASQRLRQDIHLAQREPFGLRLLLVVALWAVLSLLTVVINIVSLPIYLAATPQQSFQRYGARQGLTYVESYSRFTQQFQFTLGVIFVTVVAAGLAAGSVMLLRSQQPSKDAIADQQFVVGIIKRTTGLDPLIVRFKETLNTLGFQEGNTIRYDERLVTSEDQLSMAAQEFVTQRHDVIVAIGEAAALAAQRATRTINIPIIFLASFDPVNQGLIKSYGNSGNNLVGVGHAAPIDRQIDLLKQILPALDVVGVMAVPDDPTNQDFVEALERVAPEQGVRVRRESVATPADIPRAFAAFADAGVRSAYLAPSALTDSRLDVVAREAVASKIALIGNGPKNAEAGALLALYADLDVVGEQLGRMANRLLRGALPASMSSRFPDQTFFAINETTAAAIGLTLPPELIERADARY